MRIMKHEEKRCNLYTHMQKYKQGRLIKRVIIPTSGNPEYSEAVNGRASLIVNITSANADAGILSQRDER